jgi:hypothetical protein
MARKSPWQEFAENFQGVYGTFQKIGQDVETGRIMDDEQFTAEGKAGAGLSGGALEKARYKALGDIYTKYGNAKDGLAVRTQLADLESKDRENTINQGIMKELAYLRGQGAVRNLDANSYASEGSGANSFSSAADRTATLNARLLRMQADTDGVLSETAERNALLGGKVAAQTDASALSAANLGSVTANTAAQVLKTEAAQTAADIQAMETGFLTQINNPTFRADNNIETEADAQAALIGLYKSSNIPIERQLAVEAALTKHGIGQLQNVAVETAQAAKNELQKGGLAGVIEWYDGVDDGDATTLGTRVVDGVYELFSSAGTGSNRTETILHSGASEAELEAKLMGQITNPGSGLEIAASILEMRSKEAGIGQTKALTDQANATAEFTRENTEGLEGNRAYTEAQLGLANVRAREIRAELRQKYTTAGKAELKGQADQKALDTFLTENLPLLAMDESLDIDDLVKKFLTSRQQTAITFDPAD